MAIRRPACLLAAAALLLLAGCVQPTPYLPATGNEIYGYADERVDSSTWRISFAGNESTPREQVERLLLYRAAKLAEEKGASHFALIDKSVERETRYYGSVYPLYGLYGPHYFWHRGHHRYFAFPHAGVGSASLRPSHRYTGRASVRLFDRPPPEGLGVPYQTADVLKTIGPTVGATQP